MAATPFLSDMTDEAARRPAAVASLRTFLSAGAPIPRALVRRAAEHLGANIISAWGMTENGAVTTTRIGDPPDKTFETDGCPMEGMEIRVVDEQGAPLPANAEGRLQTRGPSNFVGYLKHPEWYATDADGWFDTGDLARIDGDGYVRITGRTKDVIIRGGENIPVVEIEGLIYQHPAIQEVALVAMPDARLGERACAFAVLREDATLTFPELIDFLEQRRLARNYLPERLEMRRGHAENAQRQDPESRSARNCQNLYGGGELDMFHLASCGRHRHACIGPPSGERNERRLGGRVPCAAGWVGYAA